MDYKAAARRIAHDPALGRETLGYIIEDLYAEIARLSTRCRAWEGMAGQVVEAQRRREQHAADYGGEGNEKLEDDLERAINGLADLLAHIRSD